MVEGPGCKNKGEKMKPRIRGQVVVGVNGNAVQKHIKAKKSKQERNSASDTKPISPFHQLIGGTVCDVQTLGKELFIFFTELEICLRVHFLMSGGFRLNGEKIDSDGGGQANAPELLVVFNKDRLLFNLSSVDIRNAEECHKKISRYIDLDICYEGFNHKRALEIVLQQNERMACDVLLDQDILPGVGNIIKNEALFDSGVKPDSKINELSEALVSFLIKMTRDFSMVFYKCRRDSKPLSPYLKIYRKPKCKQCGSQVVTTRMGEVNGRLTSFCPVCQNNDPAKLHKRILPSKNSLLGWISSSVSSTPASSSSDVTPASQEDWTCTQCTLINKSTRSNCEMCFAPKEKLTAVSSNVNNINNNSVKMTKHTTPGDKTFFTPLSSGVKRSGDSGFSSLMSENQSTESYMPQAKRQKSSQFPGTPHASSQNNLTASQSGTPTGAGPSEKVPPPVCPNHKRPCTMRQVHKQGNNYQRMFYSCPAGKGCNFFKWADESFPICDGHGKRTVLRTVLKQGSNNGRKFFACPMNKNKQCGFFQWADQY